jgi:branched-chain amino acid transport system permease protein
MNFDIALFLAQDGITTGALYAMIALGVVLIFNVTRIAFVSFGDLITYSALTLAELQVGAIPGTIWLVASLAAMALALEAFEMFRRRHAAPLFKVVALYGVIPMIPVTIAALFHDEKAPMALQMVITLALILPLGPLTYRVVFRPMSNASVLALLMAAVALHFVYVGLSLLFFGAEGLKTKSYASGAVALGKTPIAIEQIIIVATVLCFIAFLYLLFERTIYGKALRATAVNAIGARLVGIRTTTAGSVSFLLAAGMAAISGILIGPTITVYYDSGFLIGLKGFVGAVVGGFVSYPLAALGALLIGLIESFSSFYASSFKDAIVFAALIPIIIVRLLVTRQEADKDQEEEA